MTKEPQLTTQERRFESAKRAANKERDAEATARDQKTARLKAQRLAREAGEQPQPGSKRDSKV